MTKRKIEYLKHLKSDSWKKMRRRVLSLHNKGCVICGKKQVDIHHKSYYRFTNEIVKIDLIPLCRLHHKEVHKHQKSVGLPLYQATEQYIKLNKPKTIYDWNKMSRFEREKYLRKPS